MAGRRFQSFVEIKIWLHGWILQKDQNFDWNGIHNLRDRWAEVVASDGKYFDYIAIWIYLWNKRVFSSKNSTNLFKYPIYDEELK